MITSKRLSNGLLVQLKEIHSAPLISHWLWYRVGSRNEVAGKTGISHWVEHMQFKGTPRYPDGVLDKAISRDGGLWNALTNLDWTAYFETMPANKIELALDLESDRMVNSRYEPDEVESERNVVISEREGNENEPYFRLSEAVQEASFDAHPYKNEVIGYLDDLKKIRMEELYEHYHTHYAPNNAVLAIAGDFDTESMLKLIDKYYSNIPAVSMQNHIPVLESPLSSERRVKVEGPGGTTYLEIAYRSAAASSSEFMALTVVDSLLTGPSSLNMFGGGGISNKTSRLYRAIVEKELATGINGGLQATIDPFLYEIFSTVRPDKSPEGVLEAIDAEIKRLQDEIVSMDEIRRAVKQARALFAYSSENITNQAFWLGYAEMFDSYRWFEDYLTGLENVSPEDVQRIARKILDPRHRVVGIYLPNGNPDGGEE